MNPLHEARTQLGSRLRRAREDAGLTGRALALRLGWAGSKVSRIENGRQNATTEDVAAWAAAVGLASAAAQVLVDECQQARFEYAAWRTRLKHGTAARQRAGMQLDATTSLIQAFEPDMVPGLLQTPDYARCILQHVVAFDGLPDDVEEGVRTRLRRQEVLHDPAKRFQFLLAEPALRYRLCLPEVLKEQVDQLTVVSKLDNVEIRVLPLDAVLPAPLLEGFWIYGRQQVRVETLNAELTYREAYEVGRYCRVFEGLWGVGRELNVQAGLRET